VYAAPIPWCSLDETPLEDFEHDPLIGRELDRYAILEVLGEGGMGRVYRAAHRVLSREYAIKVLFGDFAGEPRFKERFRREAQSVSRVRHPNIVAVEDFGQTDDGLMFIALELVHGEPLHRVLRAHGPLPPPTAAAILRQLVLGLGAAHEAGFVHRDIKPENIMVTRDGAVKILDFGSVSLQAIPDRERLTVAGNIVGTPSYMAPEQSQDAPVGPAADLYSAGVVLFEMLTGELPFHGRTRAEILVKHIAEPPPEAPPSAGLERLVAALLEKQTHARLARASDVLALLDSLPVGPLSRTTDAVVSVVGDLASAPFATQTILVPELVTADLEEPLSASSGATTPRGPTADPRASTPDAPYADAPTPDAGVEAAPRAEPASTPRAPHALATDLPALSGTPTEPSPPSADLPPRPPARRPSSRPWWLAALLVLGTVAVLGLRWYGDGEPVRVETVPLHPVTNGP